MQVERKRNQAEQVCENQAEQVCENQAEQVDLRSLCEQRKRNQVPESVRTGQRILIDISGLRGITRLNLESVNSWFQDELEKRNLKFKPVDGLGDRNAFAFDRNASSTFNGNAFAFDRNAFSLNGNTIAFWLTDSLQPENVSELKRLAKVYESLIKTAKIDDAYGKKPR